MTSRQTVLVITLALAALSAALLVPIAGAGDTGAMMGGGTTDTPAPGTRPGMVTR